MRLIDKIAKYGVMRQQSRPTIPDGALRQMMEALRRAVCIEIGSVAQWFFETQDKQELTRLSPMFVLPFDEMWFEYVHRWNNDGVYVPDVHVGVLMETFANRTRPDPDAEACGIVFLQAEHLFTIPQVAICERFIAHTQGQQLWRVETEKATHKELSDNARTHIAEEITSMIIPALCAVSFFHCSNVRMVNEYPDKALSKRFAQKHGQPLRVMKTIDIHKPREMRGGSPSEEHSERILQAHLVRGHFKRYNNLFGSISGMWFWRPHVRGVGVPEQRDYEVHAPNEQHHGKCIVDSAQEAGGHDE